MKRIIMFALLLSALALGSHLFEQSDVAKLQPVEVLRVTVEAEGVSVETDTGQAGWGKDLERAFEDLKRRTPGDIFLDTVEFVLVNESEGSLTRELMEYLRPACLICLERGRADLEVVAAFLDIHRPKATLMNCREGKMPILVIREGEMELVS